MQNHAPTNLRVAALGSEADLPASIKVCSKNASCEAPCSQARLVSSRLRFGVLLGSFNDVLPGNALIHSVFNLASDVNEFRQ